jgi:hypothetical protein
LNVEKILLYHKVESSFLSLLVGRVPYSIVHKGEGVLKPCTLSYRFSRGLVSCIMYRYCVMADMLSIDIWVGVVFNLLQA